jgi:hypothetical protein
MATGRMLQRKISKNEAVARVVQRVDEQLGWGHGAYAALLFTWSIAHQDVEGRMEGDPRVVRANVFTMIEWISSTHVEAYIVELAREGLLVWYEVWGKRWIWFPGFTGSQPGLRRDREAASVAPDPERGRILAGALPKSPAQQSSVTAGEGDKQPASGSGSKDGPSDAEQLSLAHTLVDPVLQHLTTAAAVTVASDDMQPASGSGLKDGPGDAEQLSVTQTAVPEPCRSPAGGLPEQLRSIAGVTPPLKLEIRNKKLEDPEEDLPQPPSAVAGDSDKQPASGLGLKHGSGEAEQLSPPRRSSTLDLERVYELYPRKLGRKKGLQKCKAQIRTQVQFESLLAAVANYAAYVAGSDEKFIKHFDTFMGCWEDWIDPPYKATPQRKPARSVGYAPPTANYEEAGDMTDEL